MSDLTPEYLATVRAAASIIPKQIRTETVEDRPMEIRYAITSDSGPVVADAGTLGQAETIRTLLGAVRPLLDEVTRLRADYDRVIADMIHTPDGQS